MNEYQVLDFTLQSECPFQASVKCRKENDITYYDFILDWDLDQVEDDSSITVKWCIPMLDYMYQLRTSTGLSHHIDTDWSRETSSMISSHSPVTCIFDGRSRNRYTWALSEAKKLIYRQNGVIEESGKMLVRFRIPLKQYTGASHTEITMRVDERDVTVTKAMQDVAAWWEKDMIPADVPSAAKDPVYSFWYSFHQGVYEKEVEDECRRAKKLGFDVCIIDDGWQTGDNNRGYAYCGDWQPCTEKISDMKQHVKNVHDIGMKYILWYSVPFVGFYSEHYKEFESMYLYLSDHMKAGVLDPRYKKVRDYLIGIYVKALKDWDLDGFKLDFIDTWSFRANQAPCTPEMDIPDLFDAVDTFMTDTINTLKAIKPDILLEFRQSYIGPNMRKYGNMFRVGDCPNDFLHNRVGVLDLRMLMGNSAVHSDMLMWYADEKPETAALQITSVLFGVMQYSAKLAHMPPETYKMSAFWLDFIKSHKELLLESPFEAYEPHLLYTWAKSVSDTQSIAVAYAVDKCLIPDVRDTIYLVNGCMSERILCELNGGFKVRILDCCGREVSCKTMELKGLTALPVPTGGMAVLTK